MNPLQGRKWLSQFVSDDISCIRFKPNLNLSKDYLGFSASTNKYGLRGPSSLGGSSVMGGTSFTMGMTVNDGENWYESYINPDEWFNVGLPVGIEQQQKLINYYYQGNSSVLLYVYHPNIWSLGFRYDKLRQNEYKDYIKAMGWETNLFACYKLYLKYRIKLFFKTNQGEIFHLKQSRKKYRLNTKYFLFPMEQNLSFINSQIGIMKEVFSDFSKVILVRVPVKEQCVPIRNKQHEELLINYDMLWSHFLTNLNISSNTYVKDMTDSHFLITDYHELDNHWNAEGNLKFAEEIKNILTELGLKNLLRNDK